GLAGAWHHHSLPGTHPRPGRAVPISRAPAARRAGHSHPLRRGLVPADARLGGARPAPPGERAPSAGLARALNLRARTREPPGAPQPGLSGSPPPTPPSAALPFPFSPRAGRVLPHDRLEPPRPDPRSVHPPGHPVLHGEDHRQ